MGERRIIGEGRESTAWSLAEGGFIAGDGGVQLGVGELVEAHSLSQENIHLNECMFLCLGAGEEKERGRNGHCEGET